VLRRLFLFAGLLVFAAESMVVAAPSASDVQESKTHTATDHNALVQMLIEFGYVARDPLALELAAAVLRGIDVAALRGNSKPRGPINKQPSSASESEPRPDEYWFLVPRGDRPMPVTFSPESL